MNWGFNLAFKKVKKIEGIKTRFSKFWPKLAHFHQNLENRKIRQ